MTPAWQREIPNPQVHAQAGQIADTVFHLYQNIQALSACVPSLLLESALAIELYLKSLTAETVRHPLPSGGHQLTASPLLPSHHLDRLFDEIDPDLRDRLQSAYAQAGVDTLPTLREALLQYRNLFVDIRYTCEQRENPSLSISRLVDLVSFFKTQIDAIPHQRR